MPMKMKLHDEEIKIFEAKFFKKIACIQNYDKFFG